MNKIIPIVGIAAVIAVVGIIVTSTGGISSISYASMSCAELSKETTAVIYSTPATTAETRDQLNQLDLIKEAYQAKDCGNDVSVFYQDLNCEQLKRADTYGPAGEKAVADFMRDKNC